MKKTRHLSGLALTFFAVAGAQADVLEARDNSFSIETKLTVEGKANVVYQQLGRPGDWWDPEHTWSGSAKNLTLDLQAGGCFCEKLAKGGSIQHGRVIYVQPSVMVRLDTPLGPLQEMPVTGVLTFAFAPGEKTGQALVTMTYRVSGAFTMESAKLASIVDQVMSNQLARLRDHVGKLKQ